MVLVVFLDRVKLYYVCSDRVQVGFELLLKQPSVAAFSRNGELLAITTTTVILLLSVASDSTQIIAQFSGHLSAITQLQFSLDDRLLISCGNDGCVYGWEVQGGQRVIEHISKGSSYTCVIHDITRDVLAASASEGILRIIKKDGTVMQEYRDQQAGPYTSMMLSPTRNYMLASTIFGTIRLFEWPFPGLEAALNKSMDMPILEGESEPTTLGPQIFLVPPPFTEYKFRI